MPLNDFTNDTVSLAKAIISDFVLFSFRISVRAAPWRRLLYSHHTWTSVSSNSFCDDLYFRRPVVQAKAVSQLRLSMRETQGFAVGIVTVKSVTWLLL